MRAYSGEQMQYNNERDPEWPPRHRYHHSLKFQLRSTTRSGSVRNTIKQTLCLHGSASEIPKWPAVILDGAFRVFGREQPAPDSFKKLVGATIELLPIEARSCIV